MIKDQVPELKKLSNKLNKKMYGETIQEAEDKNICIDCKKPAENRCFTEAGKREYHISGLCEICFEELFKEN